MDLNLKIVVVFVFVILSCSFVLGAETVGGLEATVCCEKTNDGLFCQNVPEEDCSPDAKAIPTACESTALCNPGFCFDSSEGTCLDNVPQLVCNDNDGIWNENKPAQCELGCCILGDQASFVTLTRCKRLSGFLGLETNYNAGIRDEVQCLLTATAEEKGACVFIDNPADAQPTCKFVKRSECTESLAGGVDTAEEEVQEEPEENPGGEPLLGPVEFHAGILCSADSLGTECGPSEQTICLPGKEEVYFIDTCGNPANIYDANKIKDKEYWTNVKDKVESCRPNDGNENSQTCGNCNYLMGSFCRNVVSGGTRPTYGENICQDLNCVDDEGTNRIHGESWCVSDTSSDYKPLENEVSDYLDVLVGDAAQSLNDGNEISNSFFQGTGDPVGSRFYRKLCVNGEVIVEPCADFRQEECIENIRETSLGPFSEAACRVNRWQDCTAQKLKKDCTNSDVRDCRWLDGIEYTLMGGVAPGSAIEGAKGEQAKAAGGSAGLAGIGAALNEIEAGDRDLGSCVPLHAPGLNFWTGDEAAGICAQANAVCPVTYEKGLLGDDWECIENCECLPGGELELQRAQLCMAIADCGPKTNFVGSKGRTQGYKITVEDVDDD